MKVPVKGAVPAAGSPAGKARHGVSASDSDGQFSNLVERLSSGSVRSAVLVVIFTVLVFLLYSPAWNGPFIFDDEPHIPNNPHIRLEQLTLQGLWDAGFESPARNRPVANISFALNYYVHQYSTFGYHVVNVVIHVIAGVLLFVFIRLTLMIPFFRRRPFRADSIGAEAPPTVEITHADEQTATFIALAAALIWLVHPIQTQAVSYIVQRMTSMAALFYLLAFVFYIKGRLIQDAGWKRYLCYAGTAVSGLLAVGSKEIAITLPFFIVLYEWYFFRDLDRTWLKKGLIFLGISLVVLVPLGLYFTKGDPFRLFTHGYVGHDFTMTERVITQWRVVVHYLSLLVFPHPGRLNLDYAFPYSQSLFSPSTTFLSLGFLSFLFILAIYLAHRHRVLSFCILWYLGNLVLESSVIGLEMVYEHRNYLPSMLVFLAAVLVGYRFLYQKWRLVTLGILCLMLILFSFWTYQRNHIWADDLLLWQDTVAKSPNKARSHYGLGVILSDRGMSDEAIRHFQRTVEIHPDYDLAHNNLGILMQNKGDIEAAIEHFNDALRINPNYTGARSNLGIIFAKQGDLDGAIREFRRALSTASEKRDWQDIIKTRNNLGVALAQKGYVDEAIKEFTAALRMDPGNGEIQGNLNWWVSVKTRIESSVAGIRAELARHPDNADLVVMVGDIYRNGGDLASAVENYEKARSIDHSNVRALGSLALVYGGWGEYDKAITALSKIIELQPDNASAYYNMAYVHARQGRVDEAVKWLREAIERGFSNWELLRTDKDLENIRETAFCQELLKRLGER